MQERPVSNLALSVYLEPAIDPDNMIGYVQVTKETDIESRIKEKDRCKQDGFGW